MRALFLVLLLVLGAVAFALAQQSTGNNAAGGCGTNTQACGNGGGSAVAGNGGWSCLQGNGHNGTLVNNGCVVVAPPMTPIYTYAQSTTACGGNYDGFDSTAAQDVFWGTEMCGGDTDTSTMFGKCPTNGNCRVYLYFSPPQNDCGSTIDTTEYAHFYASPGTGDVDFQHTSSPYTSANRLFTSGGSCTTTGTNGGTNDVYFDVTQPDVTNWEITNLVQSSSWLNNSTWQGLFYDNQAMVAGTAMAFGVAANEYPTIQSWRQAIATHANLVGQTAVLNDDGPGAGSFPHNNGTGSAGGVINWAVDDTDICDNLNTAGETAVKGSLFEKALGNTATISISGVNTTSDWIWPANIKTLVNTASQHWNDTNCNGIALLINGDTGSSGTTSWVQRAYGVVLRGLMTRSSFDGARTTANIVMGPRFPRDIQNQNTEQTVYPEDELVMTKPYAALTKWCWGGSTCTGNGQSNADTFGGGCYGASGDTGGITTEAQLCGSVGTGPDGGTAPVLVREFQTCYRLGTSIGSCAVVANLSQTVNITISQLTLTNSYNAKLTPTGSELYDDPVTSGHPLCASTSACSTSSAWGTTAVTSSSTIPHCTIKNPGSNQAVIDAMDSTNGCFVILLNVSTGNQEVYKGVNVFDANNAYTTDISSASVDTNSAAVIANEGGNALTASAGFSSGKAIQTVNLADNTTPTWTIGTVSGGHSPPIIIAGAQTTSGNPVPWATNGTGFAYETCCSDHHGNVLNTQTSEEYEMYQVANVGTSSMQAYAGVRWNLAASLASQYMTAVGESNAANMPYIAGALISDRDCCATSGNQNGFINHAIAFLYPTTALGAHTSSWGYIRPASGAVFGSAGNCGVSVNTDCSSTSLYYGDHLRLKATNTLPSTLQTCISGGTCPEAASIVYALQHYGMFFEDQSQSAFGLIFFNDHNTVSNATWNTTDLNNLGLLHITDFDIVQRGTIICYSGHSPC